MSRFGKKVTYVVIGDGRDEEVAAKQVGSGAGEVGCGSVQKGVTAAAFFCRGFSSWGWTLQAGTTRGKLGF